MEPWVLREAVSVIDAALKEDLGSGDLTTNACVPEDAAVRGRYIAKEDGVICGLALCALVFERLGGGVSFTALKKDGEAVKKGETAALVSGNARTILSGERVGLNLLQHLSGIATATARAVKAVSGTGARITDTRKTTPGLRALEKYAVRAGGGVNHRFGLSDGILIKDNHIAAAGGITAAVKRARSLSPHTLKIEVETETMAQIEEALSAGADIIMFDNMSIQAMKEAAAFIHGRAVTEASGNMGDKTEEELLEIARAGVDLISIGALTHSVKAMDISLKFTEKEQI